MQNRNIIQILGVSGAILGAAATLLSNWALVKEQERIIEEKVDEAFAERQKEMEEES